MFSFQQVITEIGINETDLRLWIEQRWVLPARQEDSFIFDDVDLARARLIRELRVDLMVNEEAIPVVLSLLDQVHALRRALASVNAVVDKASPAVRSEIAALLKDEN